MRELQLLLVAVLVASSVPEDTEQKQLDAYKGKISILYDLLAKECPPVNRSSEIQTKPQLEIQKQLYQKLVKRLSECRKGKISTSTQKTTTTAKQQSTTTSKWTDAELSMFYDDQIRVVLDFLERDCPSHAKYRRHVLNNNPSHLDYKKHIYEHLLKALHNCRHNPTTVQPAPAVPEECKQAINYTEDWRNDHNGTDIKPGGPNSWRGYNCDIHTTNTQWFRFTGAAGNRMLNSCVKEFSCGTANAIWTDEAMPKTLGKVYEVNAYGSFYGCKALTEKIKVMRCSWDTPHDLIYKQMTNFKASCDYGFCGMM